MRRVAFSFLLVMMACWTPLMPHVQPQPQLQPRTLPEPAPLDAGPSLSQALPDSGPAPAPVQAPDAGLLALGLASIPDGGPSEPDSDLPEPGELDGGLDFDEPPMLALLADGGYGEEVSEKELSGEPSGEPGEAEVPGQVIPGDGGPIYTADLSEEVLKKLWKDDLKKLGSISVGFADQGRLINGVQFPKSEFILSDPYNSYGTQETVDYVRAAYQQVKAWKPEVPTLHINHGCAPEGGYLRPHQSHQSGRDVDIGFIYPGGVVRFDYAREKVIDKELNWLFVKALATLTDVQFILVDRRIQRILYDYALATGENRTWLDALFKAGKASLLQHARRHRLLAFARRGYHGIGRVIY